uniref:Ig-like domain-containing protein n=1 Tax=Branchiostoma floridae TaxID=7739 RepID=C3ZUB9_BRAFL|eukprot:XP_002587836.1 hypothetical protein BRAFLDRAFT_94090 [Branchiostoma floridae]
MTAVVVLCGLLALVQQVAAQIFEEAGKSVTLPCDYSFSGARYTIDWHRGAERLLNFFSEDSNPTFDSTDLSGRLSLQDGKNLVISNLQGTDDGRYYCGVSEIGGNPPGDGSDKNLVVTVDCFGSGTVAGAAVGCLAAGVLLGSAAVFILLRLRTADSKKNPTGDGISDDRQYENVRQGRVTSSLMETGNDEYEVPMETFHPPPQSSGDYQELRPAVYQSLQKN